MPRHPPIGQRVKDRPCTVEGCQNLQRCKGLCKPHYAKLFTAKSNEDRKRRYHEDPAFRAERLNASKEQNHRRTVEFGCSRNTKRYREDPEFRERVREQSRKRYCPHKTRGQHLKYKFGLTYEQYLEMAHVQNGVCAICQQPQTGAKRSLSVDHDHITGNVRGLLCNNCNRALGWFGDSVERLRAAVEYLCLHQAERSKKLQPLPSTLRLVK